MQPRRYSARETAGRYRARLRAQGLRPMQLWVPDTRAPKFAAECRRQSLAIARRPESDVEGFLESTARELEGWA
jgi:hypothetical protein